MDIMTVFYVVVYFTIGWFLSVWVVKGEEDKREELAVFLFLFWPLLIIMLGGMTVICVAMFVSVLISKLMDYRIFKPRDRLDKGEASNGAV